MEKEEARKTILEAANIYRLKSGNASRYLTRKNLSTAIQICQFNKLVDPEVIDAVRRRSGTPK